MTHRVVVLATLLALTPACLKEVFTRDGAGCDEDGACPPGQVCSTSGTCLFPCPTPDCLGDLCGCSDREYGELWDRTCREDGLCHRECMEDRTCYPGSRCDPDLGVCAKECGDGEAGFCPVGTTCVHPDSPTGFCQGDATSL
jgi:hypothetical protein